MSFFFDTYALAELMKNNPNYDKYRQFDINTSTLNVSEFYYFILRIYGKKEADYLIKKLNFKLVNIIRMRTALGASRMKFDYKKEKLSYIDCMGYILAKDMKMKFLTGDSKFKDKTNTEFVK